MLAHSHHEKQRVSTLKIGNVALAHNVILAPMSGITDKPFRQAVRHWGGGLVVSEMIASHAFLQDVWIELQKLKGAAHDEAPLSIQIAGWDPKMMAEAAHLAEMSGAQIIDIKPDLGSGASAWGFESLHPHIFEETKSANRNPAHERFPNLPRRPPD